MKLPYDVGAVVRTGAAGDTFRLVRRIGDGASGSVFEANDLRRGERVALKLLRPGASPARMQRECRALQELRHPGIVRLLAFGFTANPHRIPYLVLPLLGGATLRAVLDRQGALGLDRGLHHGMELFVALAHAHRAGIVHRDVRPENLFLERAAPLVHHLVLLDFDLAHKASGGPTAQGLTGHPRYAAPELFYGGAPTFATDLYAAGLVLFEMLTGTDALGVASEDWRGAHSLLAPPPLHALLPGARPALVWLQASLLAKDARERPASAESCVEILRTVAEAVPVANPVDPTTEDGVDSLLRRFAGPADDEITQVDPPPVSLLRKASSPDDTDVDPPSSSQRP